MVENGHNKPVEHKALGRCSKAIRPDLYHKQKCGSIYSPTHKPGFDGGEKNVALHYKYFAQRHASSKEISASRIQSSAEHSAAFYK